MSDTPLLALTGLRVAYGAIEAVKGIDLTLARGELVALIGANGAGKTTTLNAIAGTLPVAGGEIRYDGARINTLPAHRRLRQGLALVPEGRGIFTRLTVEENLRMGLATKPGGTAIPAELFELFPVLKQMIGRRGGDLSGGQQQQLAIGRALAMGPRLLILDEPTEGIQPSIIKDIERAIRMLAETGEMAILLVEQYYDFAESLADQYLLMERGEFIMRGKGETMPQDGVREALAV